MFSHFCDIRVYTRVLSRPIAHLKTMRRRTYSTEVTSLPRAISRFIAPFAHDLRKLVYYTKNSLYSQENFSEKIKFFSVKLHKFLFFSFLFSVLSIFLSMEQLHSLFQIICNREVLGTGRFTLTAFDAVRCGMPFRYGLQIGCFCFRHLPVTELFVHG